MTGFSVWVRKEALEIALTWRRYALPILVLMLAALSPVLARITPELLRSFASSDPGVVIQLPDPTAQDAVRQWAQSLSQIIAFAVIILAAGLVSNDLKEGTAQLALVKPLGRSAFITAKVTVMAAFVTIVSLLGTIVCGAMTLGIFGSVPVEDLAWVTLAWLGFAFFTICLLTLCSTVLKSQTAAAAMGIALYFVVSLLGLWEPATRFSPVGLLTGMSRLANGESFALVIPLLTAVLGGIALVALAIWHFQRQPLR